LSPRFDPSISTHLCDIFPDGTNIGEEFKFRVIATNLQGSVTSVESAPMLLASIPGKPDNPPASDETVTNSSQI